MNSRTLTTAEIHGLMLLGIRPPDGATLADVCETGPKGHTIAQINWHGCGRKNGAAVRFLLGAEYRREQEKQKRDSGFWGRIWRK